MGLEQWSAGWAFSRFHRENSGDHMKYSSNSPSIRAQEFQGSIAKLHRLVIGYAWGSCSCLQALAAGTDIGTCPGSTTSLSVLRAMVQVIDPDSQDRMGT